MTEPAANSGGAGAGESLCLQWVCAYGPVYNGECNIFLKIS